MADHAHVIVVQSEQPGNAGARVVKMPCVASKSRQAVARPTMAMVACGSIALWCSVGVW